MAAETKTVLIGCTGSVAAIKLPQLANALLDDFKVNVVVTRSAKHFFKPEDLRPEIELHTDEDEWDAWKSRGDPVLHIELAKRADVLVIAPLDANTLAKISQGICDNLLTCVTRAWMMAKPLLFCPAMNTRMWEHPITSEQIDKLKSWNYIEVPCINKTLMCGDTGLGAMAEVDAIIEQIKKYANN